MTREDIIRMAREELWGISTGRWLIPTESLERIVNRAVEAEREVILEHCEAICKAQAGYGPPPSWMQLMDFIRARGSAFPTGASAAASGQDRGENARAGHLMREIRDALRRTDPAWCAVNGVEQITDEELEELIARVEDAVEDGDGTPA